MKQQFASSILRNRFTLSYKIHIEASSTFSQNVIKTWHCPVLQTCTNTKTDKTVTPCLDHYTGHRKMQQDSSAFIALAA